MQLILNVAECDKTTSIYLPELSVLNINTKYSTTRPSIYKFKPVCPTTTLWSTCAINVVVCFLLIQVMFRQEIPTNASDRCEKVMLVRHDLLASAIGTASFRIDGIASTGRSWNRTLCSCLGLQVVAIARNIHMPVLGVCDHQKSRCSSCCKQR